MNQIQRIRRDVAEKLKLRETLLIVDIINACSLRCPSCPNGTYRPRGGMMDLDAWKKILDKAQRELRIHHIQLYSWSDVLLHPQADQFIREAADRGLPTYISTMLQRINCDFAKVIDARPRELRVSFPGWKHMKYYQAGADPDRFNETFRKIVKFPRHKETVWTMIFQWYRDNLDEFPAVKTLAEEHGFRLFVLPAIFMVPEKIVPGNYTKQDKELIARLLETPEESIARMQHRRTDYCQCWDQITLDAKGDVFLCQLVFEERFRLMNFLDTPIKDIRKAIRSHPFCRDCIAKGFSDYSELYGDFTVSDDPVGELNRFHKRERFLPR